jgi:hypothetical protein
MLETIGKLAAVYYLPVEKKPTVPDAVLVVVVLVST